MTVATCKNGHPKTPENTRKDGRCKACRREQSLRYREANPEKVKEYYRRWSEANPEKVKEKERRYCEELRRGYVASLIQMPASQVSDRLYELVKNRIQLNRLVRAGNRQLGGGDNGHITCNA